MEERYNFFMNLAYEQALKSFKINEVPIGCVIVFKNDVIATGYNKRNIEKNVLKHAEIIAIDEACNKLKDWRLEECELFVTVEPCAMCAGAILQARMKTIVFGTYNKKFGCCGSILNILDNKMFNHTVNIVPNVMQKQCETLIKDFFKLIRNVK